MSDESTTTEMSRPHEQDAWHAFEVTRAERASAKRQKSCCLWLTGLSGAGKTTVANTLERRLFLNGNHTYILDGDRIRRGLNQDLGYMSADRTENIRRIAEVARLMVDAGLITIVATISPFRSDRQFAREYFAPNEFLEIFIDTPLEVCEQRDPKGLYRKARNGQIPHFTGISSPYEPPTNPDIHVTTDCDPVSSAERVMRKLTQRNPL